MHYGKYLALLPLPAARSAAAVHARLILISSHLLATITSMSPATSSFQTILAAALDNYSNQTGIDLTKYASAEQFQNCHSPDDVLQLLLERESAFADYRNKYRELIDCLRPIVQVVHAVSGVLGEAAGLVSSGRCILPVRLYPYTPYRCQFNRRRRYSLGSMPSSQYVSPFSLLGICVISIRIRQLLASAQVTTHLVIYLNVSQISLDVFIS